MKNQRMYHNARFLDRSDQVVIFSTPIRAYHHRVRDIQPGPNDETFGWVRHQGGDWVVKLVKDHSGPGHDAWLVQEEMSTRTLVRS